MFTSRARPTLCLLKERSHPLFVNSKGYPKHRYEPNHSMRGYTLKTGSDLLPITTALTNVISKGKFAKFDETVSLHLQVTLDPRKPNQNLRSKISLPNGTGKSVTILVLTDSSSARSSASSLGAQLPPGTLAEAVKSIQSGDMSLLSSVDLVLATPSDMRQVGSLGRILGPRGLMPNPKLGSVTQDIEKAVMDAQKGEVRRGGMIKWRMGATIIWGEGLRFEEGEGGEARTSTHTTPHHLLTSMSRRPHLSQPPKHSSRSSCASIRRAVSSHP